MFFKTLVRLTRFVYGSIPNFLRMTLSHSIDLVSTAINVAGPIIVIDRLSQAHDHEHDDDHTERLEDLYIAAGVGAVFICAQMLPKLRSYLLNSVRANVQSELTMAMVEKAYRLELDSHLTARTGDFAQALSKNYSSIDKLMPGFFGEIIPFGLDVTAITGYLSYKFGPIGLFPPAVATFYFIVALIAERLALKVRHECVTESYAGYAAVLRAIENYELAHQFGNVGYELDKVRDALAATEKKYKRMHHRDDTNALIGAIINNVGIVGAVALLLFVPKLGIWSGTNNVFDMIEYAYFLNYLYNKTNTLPSAISSFFTAVTDAERVIRFLERKSSVIEQRFADVLRADPSEPLSIRFENVSFSYGVDSSHAIRNLSFDIEPGQRMAVVGPTGSGKSTLIKLLLRFYEPSEGRIFVNDIDIKDYTLESLRNAFAFCAQANSMFDGTVADNIRYGDLEADDTAVIYASRYAELTSEDPDDDLAATTLATYAGGKLSQYVGRSGGMISGGEKQRTAIGRMLLHGGAAAILDEPTSSLDPATEREVQKTLDTCTDGITTITVTHRYPTVVSADYIIYLENGQIVEQGTFNQLVEARGKFYGQLQVQCQELGLNAEDIIISAAPEEESSSSQASFREAELVSFWGRRQRQREEQRHGEELTESSQIYRESIQYESIGSGGTTNMKSLPV